MTINKNVISELCFYSAFKHTENFIALMDSLCYPSLSPLNASFFFFCKQQKHVDSFHEGVTTK